MSVEPRGVNHLPPTALCDSTGPYIIRPKLTSAVLLRVLLRTAAGPLLSAAAGCCREPAAADPPRLRRRYRRSFDDDDDSPESSSSILLGGATATPLLDLVRTITFSGYETRLMPRRSMKCVRQSSNAPRWIIRVGERETSLKVF